MIILGIETSCDETAAAICNNGKNKDNKPTMPINKCIKIKVSGLVLKISQPALNHFNAASALKIRNCVDILALN